MVSMILLAHNDKRLKVLLTKTVALVIRVNEASMQLTGQVNKYQGVKNFTLVARMQNINSILRATDESSMF